MAELGKMTRNLVSLPETVTKRLVAKGGTRRLFA